MKDFLLIFSLILIASGSVCSESTINKTDVKNEEEIKKNKREVFKVTKAYKEAKDKCLKSVFDMKGKKLRDCIVDTQKEVK